MSSYLKQPSTCGLIKELFFNKIVVDLPDEKVALLDESVLNVVGLFKKSNHFPHFSPFENHNAIFSFYSKLASEPQQAIEMKLASIIRTEILQNQTFSFVELDSVSASKSSSIDWNSMEKFGKYCFEKYLPSFKDFYVPSDNVDRKQEQIHQIDGLLKVLKEAKEKNLGFFSVKYKQWCDRLVINNEDRSHRFSAISYLAKQGVEGFDEAITAQEYNVETLNENVLNELSDLADYYVFHTSKKYFNELSQVLPSYPYNIAYFESRICNIHDLQESIFIVSILKPKTINQAHDDCYPYSNSDEKKQHLLSQEILKPQFDRLLNAGHILTLNEFIDRVCAEWANK